MLNNCISHCTYFGDERKPADKPRPPWDDYETNFKQAQQHGGFFSPEQVADLLAKIDHRLKYVAEEKYEIERKKMLGLTGTVERHERHLRIEFQFLFEIESSALIAYLLANDCTNIHVTVGIKES